VSSVKNMDFMFRQADSFKQNLCSAAWINSKASRTAMFLGSSGSRSCATTKMVKSAKFQPKSIVELQNAVRVCLNV